MLKTINDIIREVVEGEGECGCEPNVFACSENHAKLMSKREGDNE
jgi:hypothetical protein